LQESSAGKLHDIALQAPMGREVIKPPPLAIPASLRIGFFRILMILLEINAQRIVFRELKRNAPRTNSHAQ
jgi:hypothetical protein